MTDELIQEIYQHAINGVTTDSRGDVAGKLFIPIVGENFNGHDYIKDALDKGAVCALTEVGSEVGSVINVPSTRQALIDLATYSRSQFTGPVVAITGSAGKTTTKEIIASVLSQKYKTLKTQGNFNNDIGLPLTLLSRKSDHEALVLEMGMNHRGEISILSKIGRPTICMITNIGDAHIENLGSREGILQAKAEIFDGLQDGGTVILNGDDPLLTGLPAVSHAGKTIYCRMADATFIKYHGLKGTSCRIFGTEVYIPLPGDHMIMNALMAFATGLELGLTPSQIAEGIKSFTPTGHRMAISEVGSGSSAMTIINDTYNASPPSMKAAIDMLVNADQSDTKTRKVCIFGDMFELGDFAEEMHKDVGQYAREKIDLLISIGELSRHMDAEHHFETKESFVKEWKTILRPGDTVLIKASRGMKLEEIIGVFITS